MAIAACASILWPSTSTHASGLTQRNPENRPKSASLEQLGAVLDGERGELGIRGEVGARSDFAEQSEGDLEVAWSRLYEVHMSTRQPLCCQIERAIDGERPLEHSRIGGDPHEAEQCGGRDADFTPAVELLLPPTARLGVVGRGVEVSVEQEVDVGQDQRVRPVRLDRGVRTCVASTASSSSSSARAFSRVRSQPGRNAVL